MTDLLLEWISFRRAGRINDVPANLAGGGVIHRILDDLAVLGHLERPNRASWKVAPPALAGLPTVADREAAAVLCGARTHGVLASLAAACQGVGAQMSSIAMPGRPAVIRIIAASSAELASAAATAGIPLQHAAALTLLACTPAIRNWPCMPCEMVGGRVEAVRRFSRSRIGWVESTLAEVAATKVGFFRIKRDWDWVSILKTGVSQCAYIDDRAGRLAAVEKAKAISWAAGSQILELPGQLFPPLAIARALSLCSGFLPRYERASRRISFADVPPEILRLTLDITGLKLA